MKLGSRNVRLGVLGLVNTGDVGGVCLAWDTRPQREQSTEKPLHHERRVAS
jgi:hypothetical protein